MATAVLTVLLIFYGNYKIWHWMEKEQTIAYTVSPPKIPEDAKVLEQPAVKVRWSIAQVCERLLTIITRYPVRQLFNVTRLQQENFLVS